MLLCAGGAGALAVSAEKKLVILVRVLSCVCVRFWLWVSSTHFSPPDLYHPLISCGLFLRWCVCSETRHAWLYTTVNTLLGEQKELFLLKCLNWWCVFNDIWHVWLYTTVNTLSHAGTISSKMCIGDVYLMTHGIDDCFWSIDKFRLITIII